MPTDRLTELKVNDSLNAGESQFPWAINHLLLAWTRPEANLQPLLSHLKQRLPHRQIGRLTVASEPLADWLLADANQPAVLIQDDIALIDQLVQHQFDAVIIFTQPAESPFSIAYLCYLAGIPIRVGQSSEFGGTLLSHPVQPPLDPVSPEVYCRHLLDAIFDYPKL
jgi:ADP-heptose:LPS heptosyltransferase